MEKITNYTRNSKVLLDQQLGGLSNTASAVGSQIRLAESSIDKQQATLERAVETLMQHTSNTEGFVKGISNEITTLTARLQNEIKGLIEEMLGNLKQVSGMANETLAETGRATTAFSDSVSMMNGSIKTTVGELDDMNEKMAVQANGLVQMSQDVANHLEPLTKLMAGYREALPGINADSEAMAEKVRGEIAAMDEKIKNLNATTNESVIGMADSSLRLEKLTEQSRQQMIELLSDYSSALEKMEKLKSDMEIARAKSEQDAAAMRAEVARAEQERVAAYRAREPKTETIADKTPFMEKARGMIERLNEVSMDMTQALNSEIPDAIWDRYSAGDKGVFAKWFAKIISTADKKKFMHILKSDAEFRKTASEFMRGFHKMLLDARADDNSEAITATLLKTDLGRIYIMLREFVA
jgi:DNA repair exonuclease SbcCD ATPase subunit